RDRNVTGVKTSALPISSDIAFSAYFAPGMSYRKLDVNPVSPDRRFASGAVQNQTLVQLSERQQETPSQQGSAQQLQQSRDWGWEIGRASCREIVGMKAE